MLSVELACLDSQSQGLFQGKCNRPKGLAEARETNNPAKTKAPSQETVVLMVIPFEIMSFEKGRLDSPSPPSLPYKLVPGGWAWEIEGSIVG